MVEVEECGVNGGGGGVRVWWCVVVEVVECGVNGGGRGGRVWWCGGGDGGVWW